MNKFCCSDKICFIDSFFFNEKTSKETNKNLKLLINKFPDLKIILINNYNGVFNDSFIKIHDYINSNDMIFGIDCLLKRYNIQKYIIITDKYNIEMFKNFRKSYILCKTFSLKELNIAEKIINNEKKYSRIIFLDTNTIKPDNPNIKEIVNIYPDIKIVIIDNEDETHDFNDLIIDKIIYNGWEIYKWLNNNITEKFVILSDYNENINLMYNNEFVYVNNYYGCKYIDKIDKYNRKYVGMIVDTLF